MSSRRTRLDSRCAGAGFSTNVPVPVGTSCDDPQVERFPVELHQQGEDHAEADSSGHR